MADLEDMKETMAALQSKISQLEAEKNNTSAEYAALLSSTKGMREMHDTAVEVMQKATLKALEGAVTSSTAIFAAKTRLEERIRSGINQLAQLWRSLLQEKKRGVLRALIRRYKAAKMVVSHLTRNVQRQYLFLKMMAVESMVVRHGAWKLKVAQERNTELTQLLQSAKDATVRRAAFAIFRFIGKLLGQKATMNFPSLLIETHPAYYTHCYKDHKATVSYLSKIKHKWFRKCLADAKMRNCILMISTKAAVEEWRHREKMKKMAEMDYFWTRLIHATSSVSLTRLRQEKRYRVAEWKAKFIVWKKRAIKKRLQASQKSFAEEQNRLRGL